jgi:hypothetical protein
VFAESSPNPEEALAFLENYPGKALAWELKDDVPSGHATVEWSFMNETDAQILLNYVQGFNPVSVEIVSV